jgi:hypothetical protein
VTDDIPERDHAERHTEHPGDDVTHATSGGEDSKLRSIVSSFSEYFRSLKYGQARVDRVSSRQGRAQRRSVDGPVAKNGVIVIVRTTHSGPVIEHALGWLGLFLLGLTGWAAERLQGRAPIAAFIARLVLARVTAIGRFIDRRGLPAEARS